MNNISKYTLAFVVGSISALLIAIDSTSSPDYVERIVDNMPQEAYEQIIIELGNQSSDDFQIAKRYLANQKYYDSLSNN